MCFFSSSWDILFLPCPSSSGSGTACSFGRGEDPQCGRGVVSPALSSAGTGARLGWICSMTRVPLCKPLSPVLLPVLLRMCHEKSFWITGPVSGLTVGPGHGHRLYPGAQRCFSVLFFRCLLALPMCIPLMAFLKWTQRFEAPDLHDVVGFSGPSE